MDRNEKKIALNKQIQDVKEDLQDKAEDLKDLSKDALVVGGILVAAYSLMRLFQSDEPESEQSYIAETEEPSIVSSTLKGVATSVLLALAKAKLSEYLESLDDGKDS